MTWGNWCRGGSRCRGTDGYRLSINAGYDYNVKRVNCILEKKSLIESEYFDSNKEEGHFHNKFASANYKYRKFNVKEGIRTTFYQERNKWVNSPRLNVQYEILSGLKLKAEAGIFHQFISQLREYGANVLPLNNPLWIINSTENETSQKAQKVATGFIFHKNGWLLDLEAYYSQNKGLSTLPPLFNELTPNGFSKGSSTIKGIDMLLKKRWEPFNVWLNYSLGKINYLFPDVAEESFAAPNDIRHNASLMGSYQFRKLHFSLTGKYHSGLPYSKPNGLIGFYDEEDEATTYEVDYGKINNERLRQYFRLDFGVNYRPTFKKYSNLKAEFSLSIINILNRENVLDRGYYTDLEVEAEIPPLVFVNRFLLNRTPLLLVRFYW